MPGRVYEIGDAARSLNSMHKFEIMFNLICVQYLVEVHTKRGEEKQWRGEERTIIPNFLTYFNRVVSQYQRFISKMPNMISKPSKNSSFHFSPSLSPIRTSTSSLLKQSPSGTMRFAMPPRYANPNRPLLCSRSRDHQQPTKGAA